LWLEKGYDEVEEGRAVVSRVVGQLSRQRLSFAMGKKEIYTHTNISTRQVSEKRSKKRKEKTK